MQFKNIKKRKDFTKFQIKNLKQIKGGHIGTEDVVDI